MRLYSYISIILQITGYGFLLIVIITNLITLTYIINVYDTFLDFVFILYIYIYDIDILIVKQAQLTYKALL